MEVHVHPRIPPEYAYVRPLREYETQLIATGLRRYNVQTKTVSTLTSTGGRIYYDEVPYTGTILPRGYATELVRMVVYSESPKIWAEVVAPDIVYFFQQVKQPETT